jgi:hypothetical protein
MPEFGDSGIFPQLFPLELRSRYNRFHRAVFSACTAIRAQLCIDHVFIVAFGNGLHGAFPFTASARDTFVGDCVRHSLLILPFIFEFDLQELLFLSRRPRYS